MKRTIFIFLLSICAILIFSFIFYEVKNKSIKTDTAVTAGGVESQKTNSENSHQTTESVSNNNENGAALSGDVVVNNQLCNDSGLFEIESKEGQIFLKQKCGNVVYHVGSWEFEKNNIQKKKYGVVVYAGYKCACHDEIGYFDFADVQQEGDKWAVASSSIVAYPTLTKEFGSTVSVHYFNELPYLLITSGQNIYKVEPDTKLVTKILTLNPWEDFYGPDLPADRIDLLDPHRIEVRVFVNSTSTTSPLSVETKILSI